MKQLVNYALAVGLLAACSPQTTVPATPTSPTLASTVSVMPLAPAAPLLPKLAEPHSLAAKIVSGENFDKITIQLGDGFKTQALDTSTLSYLRIWVTGPGFNGRVYATGGDADNYINVTGPGGATATFGQIPKGQNRVLTAQFYDIGKTEVATAYAKGVYSSGSNDSVSVVINRAQIPLAETMESLQSSDPALLVKLEVDQLKTILNNVLGWNGTSFTVDPSRFVAGQLVTALTGTQGIPANFQASLTPGSQYIRNTASLQFNVSGLVGSDKVKVRLQDPTSPLIEVGNGPITINNILPGTWELSIAQNAGISYSGLFPAETLTFVAGDSLNRANVNLTYTTPSIDSFSITKGPRKTEFLIDGENFHTDAATNVVTFTEGANVITATVTAASSTQLTVTVPEVVNAAVQNVTVAIGAQTSASETFEVQKVWYVKTDGDALALGDAWERATTLTRALADAGTDEQIWLQAGLYTPSDTDRSVSFEITRPLTLIGGFSGTETTASQSDLTLYETILSGDLNQNDTVPAGDINDATRSENSYHVLKVTDAVAGSGAILKNLIVSDGNANGNDDGQPEDPNGGGGGCCGFPDPGGPGGGDPPPNLDEDSGGGVFNLGKLTLQGVVFRNNSAHYGAGVASINDLLVEQSSRFESNLANSSGGGVFNAATMIVQDSRLENNQASDSGGAIGSSNVIRLYRNIFKSNQASSGGAASIDQNGFVESPVIIEDNVFLQNTANDSGGAVSSSTNRASVFRNVFAQNSSLGNDAFSGGGAWRHSSGGSYIEMSNNLFYANHANSNGGGAFIGGNGSSSDTFRHNSFIQNTSNQAMGQALVWDFFSRSLNLANSLFVDNNIARTEDVASTLTNNATNLPDIATLLNEGASTFAAPTTTNLIFNLVPGFQAAATPAGADGIWRTSDDGFIPAPGSPLIGAGTTGNGKDVRGVNHPSNPDPTVIGAYEPLP